MRVKNQTHWQTRDLKRIFCEALRRDSEIEGKLSSDQRVGLVVEIVYSRRTCYSGCAYYNGYLMRLRIPRYKWQKKDKSGPTTRENIEKMPVPVDKKALVELFVHELAHFRGYHHNKLGKHHVTFLYSSWAEDDEKYPVREKIEKPKPKADLRLKRYANVLKKIAEKETTLKRLQRLLKKWRQKQRYYEKILVAAGKLPKRRKEK